MIYDTLNNLPNYLGLCSSLDSVIEFIMARDINNLPAGRTRIDGEKAVVTVSTVTPQSSDKALFQRHDAHIVLETDLEGSERVIDLVLGGDLLREEGIFIFEHSKQHDFSEHSCFWQLRSYGSVQFSFFKKA